MCSQRPSTTATTVRFTGGTGFGTPPQLRFRNALALFHRAEWLIASSHLPGCVHYMSNAKRATSGIRKETKGEWRISKLTSLKVLTNMNCSDHGYSKLLFPIPQLCSPYSLRTQWVVTRSWGHVEAVWITRATLHLVWLFGWWSSLDENDIMTSWSSPNHLDYPSIYLVMHGLNSSTNRAIEHCEKLNPVGRPEAKLQVILFATNVLFSYRSCGIHTHISTYKYWLS